MGSEVESEVEWGEREDRRFLSEGARSLNCLMIVSGWEGRGEGVGVKLSSSGEVGQERGDEGSKVAGARREER